MDRIEAMRVFLRVAETGSFSLVARERGTQQPTISKQVAGLERGLGVRLLQRTTRTLSLTEEGRAFAARAAAALDAFDEAQACVGPGREAPSGLLRISCPVAFGRLHVAPRLRRLLDQHPDLRIELLMSDGFANLVEQGIDLAIRVGALPDASLVARRIGLTRRVTVGAPDYLARRGVPETPADLARHECIVYSRLATGSEWHFAGRDGAMAVRVSGRVMADNSEAVREAVLAGCGIAVTPTWLFRDELRDGSAVVVLKTYEPVPLPIQAVHPSRRYVPAKVRAAIGFFAQEFRIDPVLSDYGADA
ncbi:MAG: LysR family transcriptional regulator [Methylobacterium sp.]|nr:LysR family transcriptional regulator [Methylobacterium sp.]